VSAAGRFPLSDKKAAQVVISWKDQIQTNKLPGHIAIIMDGNGRWAKSNNQPRIYGHYKGVETVKEITETCAKLGIKYLTLYAFSTENWYRPENEVIAIMELLVKTIKNETETLLKNDIRLQAIGDIDSLPEACFQELQEAMEQTANKKRMVLNLALSYSGRSEITRAVQHIAQDVMKNRITPEEINEDIIKNYLDTGEIPDPELMIRTSGECRMSNFLLWQSAYAELYFTDTLWPDFDSEELYKSIVNFQNRERRFGKISEQITAE
jgi:undecaprenyl diphosphate synthase